MSQDQQVNSTLYPSSKTSPARSEVMMGAPGGTEKHEAENESGPAGGEDALSLLQVALI